MAEGGGAVVCGGGGDAAHLAGRTAVQHAFERCLGAENASWAFWVPWKVVSRRCLHCKNEVLLSKRHGVHHSLNNTAGDAW